MAARNSLAERRIAGDGPNLDERLPLPGAAQRVVVASVLASERASGPRLPSGRKPQIDAVGDARGRCVTRASGTTSVTTRAKNSALVTPQRRPVRLAFVVVDEHQVDVAGVVQLLAAELAERQDRDAALAGHLTRQACRSAADR